LNIKKYVTEKFLKKIHDVDYENRKRYNISGNGDIMFLHVGGDYIISAKDIIAIMDIERTTVSNDTRNFLKIAEEEGFTITLAIDEMPKSFIVAQDKHKSKIILSPISTNTLLKRYKILNRKNITNM
jgi:regulator of extracellular matrix RemA (YlzA/DUF370 family)